MKALLEVRRSVPGPDADTVLQKFMNHEAAMTMFDPSYEYRHSATGYITKADHASMLNKPGVVHDGLRRDYEGHLPLEERAFRPDNENPIYAIRFQSNDAHKLLTPDQRVLDELAKWGVEVKAPYRSTYAPGHPEIDQQPNMGQGFAGSSLKETPIIPEYKMPRNTGARLKHGAEIWEIDKSGKEFLVGIFDKSLNEGIGEWRTVLSSIG